MRYDSPYEAVLYPAILAAVRSLGRGFRVVLHPYVRAADGFPRQADIGIYPPRSSRRRRPLGILVEVDPVAAEPGPQLADAMRDLHIVRDGYVSVRVMNQTVRYVASHLAREIAAACEAHWPVPKRRSKVLAFPFPRQLELNLWTFEADERRSA